VNDSVYYITRNCDTHVDSVTPLRLRIKELTTAQLHTQNVCDYLNLSLFSPNLPAASQPVHDNLQLSSLMLLFVNAVAAVESSALLEKLQLRLSHTCSAATDSCPFPVTLWVKSAICGGNKEYRRHIVRLNVKVCADICYSGILHSI